MPARVSSSVQGAAPGDLRVLFFSWQEFVALATSTYIDPSASMKNGCIGWSPPSGNPETMVSPETLGTIEPVASEYRTMRSFDLGVERALIYADARTAGSTALDGFAKTLNHGGPSRTAKIL
jgi:hypothetical protein